MPIQNSRKNSPNTKKNPTSVSDIVVRRSQQHKKSVPVLTADKVPAGTYRSTVLAVNDAQNDEGNPMVDVVYRFTSSGGKSAEAKIRYPIVGYYIDRLIDALIDAGLPEGASLVDAVGLEEEVTVVYPYEGALGKIKSRRPANQAVPAAAKKPVSKQMPTKKRKLLVEDEEEAEEVEDFDEEFDDFLEEDDE